jgi:hypothetical protein
MESTRHQHLYLLAISFVVAAASAGAAEHPSEETRRAWQQWQAMLHDRAEARQKTKVVLVLNEQSVDSSVGVDFHFNPAKKHEANPVLIPGMPHEIDGLQVSWPSVGLWDPIEKRLRYYYNGREALQYDSRVHPLSVGFERWLGRLWRHCYAESTDGITWEKPRLSQVTLGGLDTNGIKTDYEAQGDGVGWNNFCSLQTVWINPTPSGSEERFCALGTEIGSDGKGNRTFAKFHKTLYYSPDGKRWKRQYVVADFSNPNGYPAPDTIDRNAVIFDPDDPDPDRRCKVYGQTDKPEEGRRGYGVVTGPDLKSIKRDNRRLVLVRDSAVENQIHWATVKKLDNGYFVAMHDSWKWDEAAQPVTPKGDLRLAISSDGLDFSQFHPKEPVVARSANKGMWDHNWLVTGDIVETEDAVWFFYHGAPVYFRPWPQAAPGAEYRMRATNVYPLCLGLAILPRDRFAYAAPKRGQTGTMTSKSVALPADSKLWLNSEVPEGAALAMELIDRGENVVATGEMTNDAWKTVYRQVAFDKPVPGGEYRLRTHLSGAARLYSFAVTRR